MNCIYGFFYRQIVCFLLRDEVFSSNELAMYITFLFDFLPPVSQHWRYMAALRTSRASSGSTSKGCRSCYSRSAFIIRKCKYLSTVSSVHAGKSSLISLVTPSLNPLESCAFKCFDWKATSRFKKNTWSSAESNLTTSSDLVSLFTWGISFPSIFWCFNLNIYLLMR